MPLFKALRGILRVCVLCVFVRVPARLSADSYATVPCPRYSPASTPPSCHSQRALAGHWVCYIYLRRDCGWMRGGGLAFYFGPVACERDSYCYCCEGLFSVSSDLSELHGIVIQLCQHVDCWVGETAFSHFSASLDLFQVALYHKLSVHYHFFMYGSSVQLALPILITLCTFPLSERIGSPNLQKKHFFSHLPLVVSWHADSFVFVFSGSIQTN